MSDLQRLRAHLGRALGDDRLATLDPDAPLLQGGVVSSLELVVLLAALREGYGVEVTPARAAQELRSLSAILDLVAGRRAPTAADAPQRPGWGLWRRFCRRPGRALLGALLCLVLIDQGYRVAVERLLWGDYLRFREHGERLYPLAGHLGQDDFAAAAAVHEIVTEPDPPEGWVLVLGDSGTNGSYLDAHEAWPQRAEAHLAAQGVDARIANLAYYGRLLVKDLMLLEIVRDEPLRAVVLTLGDDYVSRQLTTMWLEDFPHISLNRPWLERYVERLPAAEQAPFRDSLAILRAADRAQGGALKRFGYRHTGLLRYRHYLRDLLLDRALPDTIGTRVKRIKLTREQRLATSHTQLARNGVPRDDLDRDMLEVLRGTLTRLRARGLPVVLVLEPAGPHEWRRPGDPRLLDTGPLFAALAAETGATLVDLRWVLGVDAFTDTLAHYTPAGADLLGARVADALAEALR